MNWHIVKVRRYCTAQKRVRCAAFMAARRPGGCRGAGALNRLRAMFEARFQTFDEPGERAASAGRARGAARRTRSAAGSTASSCRAPTATRTNTCRRREERLAWLTGFTGSAGAAIVLADRAVIFVDGRYTAAGARPDRHRAVRRRAPGREPARQVARGKPAGRRALRLRPVAAHRRRRREARQGLRRPPARRWCRPSPIRSTRSGPTARPAARRGRAARPAIRRRGRAPTSSRASQAEIGKLKADALVVSDPHNVAWTFNIRGADVAHTPLPLAFAIVPREGRAALYVDGRKLSNAVRDYLETLADVREPGAFAATSRRSAPRKATVRLDPGDRRRRARAPDRARPAARSRAAPIRSR